MKYIEFTFFEVPDKARENILAELSLLDMNGIEEGDDVIHVFFEEASFPESKCKLIAEQYNLKYDQKIIEEENWNETWENNFQPLIIDGYCSVRAHFHPAPSSILYDIIITPKMSFGTGHHATTDLMITMMRVIDFKEKTVFDYGTGTGILAILAKKSGAASIFAIDIDKWSVENAKENFQFNDADDIELAQGTLEQVSGSFDIILANINRNVLTESMKGLHDLLKPDGQLLLSGILLTDQEIIEHAAFENGFKLIKSDNKNNWMAMLFHKPNPDAHVL